MKVVLIFPKLFEFVKFLSYLLQDRWKKVLDIHQVDPNEYHIYLEDFTASRQLCFEVLLIEDSDINFYALFSKLIANKQETNYILLGSCGSSKAEDLGKCFVLKEAVKGDRGKLDLSGRFEFDPNKKIVRSHELWDTESYTLLVENVEERKACSTNFLNMHVIDKDFGDYLFDMETYDFYDVCLKRGVKMFTCIRFVTDYVFPLNTDNPQDLATTYQNKIPETLRHLFLTEGGLPLEKRKKYFRLKLTVDFNFLFKLNLEGNKLNQQQPNRNNTAKYYTYFYNKYVEKVEDIVLDIHKKRSEEILKENFKKSNPKLTGLAIDFNIH